MDILLLLLLLMNKKRGRGVARSSHNHILEPPPYRLKHSTHSIAHTLITLFTLFTRFITGIDGRQVPAEGCHGSVHHKGVNWNLNSCPYWGSIHSSRRPKGLRANELSTSAKGMPFT